VDDDAVDREAVRRTVRAAGLETEVTEAATAEDALGPSRGATVRLHPARLPAARTDGLAVLADIRARGVDTP
jgi:CheY-like chemotaxis protein